LTIDCSKHDGQPKRRLGDPPVIGYFARICEEKGLHRLVEACALLRERIPRFRLVAGGYLAADRKTYLDRVRKAAAAAKLDFEYVGSPATHAEKVAFFKSLDLFSVPTVYREPKGIYVLESLANGVPAALPDHGAFPELIASTGGGILFPADDLQALADALALLIEQTDQRQHLAQAGWEGVRAAHDFPMLAAASERLFLSGRVARDRQNPPVLVGPD
jgi:glycosyltransferase involved in cell wall biosynthesis